MAGTFDIFGLGQCSLDCIGRIDAYPPPDVKCECSETVIQGGGPVATALVALSQWGISCAFTGVIGDDLFGSMIDNSAWISPRINSTVLKKPEEQDSMAPRFIPYHCPGMSLQQKLYLGWMIRNL